MGNALASVSSSENSVGAYTSLFSDGSWSHSTLYRFLMDRNYPDAIYRDKKRKNMEPSIHHIVFTTYNEMTFLQLA